MALNFAHKLWETTNVWSTDVGSADLPASAGVGSFNVGDMVINVNSSAVGQPWGWTCVAATGSPVVTLTWQAIAVIGFTGSGAVRKTGVATTVASADRYVELSTAVAVTLPAATAYPTAKPVTVINSSVGSVTVTPASGSITTTAGSTAAAVTLATGTNAEVISDATQWIVMA